MSRVGTHPRIGSELLGYRVDALLGRGGMGVVYRAYDLRLKRNVALKLIAPELSGDGHFRERFLTETELAASLEHHSVVPIYDAGEHEGQLYLAMRYVEGSDLRALLREEGPLDPARAIAICSQVAEALDAAHERGLVHRDVKPSNILLDSHEHVYLADFGLSRRLSEQAPGMEATLSLGTPAYVAPEQIEGKAVDGRADVYSLACVFYECLTGEPPYLRESELAVLFAHLEEPPPSPPGLEGVMAMALAKRPDDRYASCGELVRATADGLGLSNIRRDRRPLLLAGTGVVLALAAALAAFVLTSSDSGGPARPSTKPTLTPKTHSLQRIDPKTNALAATIRLGPNPSAVAVGAGAVWVTNRDTGTISRIDARTNAVTKTAVAGSDPTGLAVGDGVVWTANSEDWTLVQVDPETLEIIRSVQLPIDCFPCGVAIGNGEMWATDTAAVERFSLFGLLIATIEDPIRIETLEHPIAVGEGAVWVIDNGGLVRIDPASNRIAARIEILVTPFATLDAGGIAAGEGAVWVTNPVAGTVSRISPASNRVSSRIKVGKTPLGVAVGEGSVWVANSDAGTVSRIDPDQGKVVATLRIGPNPTEIAVGAGGVWVTVSPT
jgi:YVTN family beta-propeller protein